MPAVSGHKTKKRKHAAVEVGGEPSTKRSKTGREKAKHVSKASGDKHLADGQFKVIRATLAVSIPPVFASKPREGAEEMLDSLVMRYVPALRGILLAHDNLHFMSSSATIKGDCPFANCTISFDATVWSPRIGMKLAGKVNLYSPDHVSLLIHRTFNVSIPRHHIPSDDWEFEYGPAENDPEYGGNASNDAEPTVPNAEAVEHSGRWVHKLTGEKLGGDARNLEFTVIGLTVANQMLSLVGSIQYDPFSPEHIPDHTATVVAPTRRPITQPAPPIEENPEGIDEAADSEDDLDTFETLARMNDHTEEAEKTEKKIRDEENADRKERKRKRKAEKAAARSEGGEGQPEKKKKKKTKDSVS